MKRHIAFMAFFVSFACLAAPTANEDFVLAEDAQTFTNAVNAAKEYADGKIAGAGSRQLRGGEQRGDERSPGVQGSARAGFLRLA